MSKVKVKIKPAPKKSGTLLARVPVAVVKTDRPAGERLFQTRAEIVAHLNRGSRPSTFKPRRAR